MADGPQGACLPAKSEELRLKPVTRSIRFIRYLLAAHSTATSTIALRTIDLRTRTLPVQTKALVHAKAHQSQLRQPLLRRGH